MHVLIYFYKGIPESEYLCYNLQTAVSKIQALDKDHGLGIAQLLTEHHLSWDNFDSFNNAHLKALTDVLDGIIESGGSNEIRWWELEPCDQPIVEQLNKRKKITTTYCKVSEEEVARALNLINKKMESMSGPTTDELKNVAHIMRLPETIVSDIWRLYEEGTQNNTITIITKQINAQA